MRRLLYALWLLLIPVHSVGYAAPPLQECGGVSVSSPKSNDQVRGRIEITGSANIPQFQFYKVEYAPGSNPSESSFRSIGPDVRRAAVTNGVLEVWDTASVSDGPHVVRLTVVDIRGNFPCPPVSVRVTVANRAATPTVTAPPTGTPEATGTPAVVGPGATRPAAPTIFQPPVTPRPTATVTPTPGGTEARSPINLDFLSDLAPALWWGVCGMVGLVALSLLYVTARAVLDRL